MDEFGIDLPGTPTYFDKPTSSLTFPMGAIVGPEGCKWLNRLTNHIATGPTPIRTDVGAQATESEEVLSSALGGDCEFRGIRPPSAERGPRQHGDHTGVTRWI